jgi:hypothetical protein
VEVLHKHLARHRERQAGEQSDGGTEP